MQDKLKGPKTEHWGTPQIILANSDKTSIWTYSGID